MTKRRLRFIEFLLIGIGMGVIEDLIAIRLATDATIDLRILIIVFLVAIPFAFISEIVVDHPRFWEKLFPSLRKLQQRSPALTERRLRILEFLLIGIGMGITEDMIAVMLATGESFSFHILIIVVAVAIPFAFISEIVVDHPRFWEQLFPKLTKSSKQKSR